MTASGKGKVVWLWGRSLAATSPVCRTPKRLWVEVVLGDGASASTRRRPSAPTGPELEFLIGCRGSNGAINDSMFGKTEIVLD